MGFPPKIPARRAREGRRAAAPRSGAGDGPPQRPPESALQWFGRSQRCQSCANTARVSGLREQGTSERLPCNLRTDLNLFRMNQITKERQGPDDEPHS